MKSDRTRRRTQELHARSPEAARSLVTVKYSPLLHFAHTAPLSRCLVDCVEGKGGWCSLPVAISRMFLFRVLCSVSFVLNFFYLRKTLARAVAWAPPFGASIVL